MAALTAPKVQVLSASLACYTHCSQLASSFGTGLAPEKGGREGGFRLLGSGLLAAAPTNVDDGGVII